MFTANQFCIPVKSHKASLFLQLVIGEFIFWPFGKGTSVMCGAPFTHTLFSCVHNTGNRWLLFFVLFLS
jgi:hypothetical protein